MSPKCALEKQLQIPHVKTPKGKFSYVAWGRTSYLLAFAPVLHQSSGAMHTLSAVWFCCFWDRISRSSTSLGLTSASQMSESQACAPTHSALAFCRWTFVFGLKDVLYLFNLFVGQSLTLLSRLTKNCVPRLCLPSPEVTCLWYKCNTMKSLRLYFWRHYIFYCFIVSHIYIMNSSHFCPSLLSFLPSSLRNLLPTSTLVFFLSVTLWVLLESPAWKR